MTLLFALSAPVAAEDPAQALEQAYQREFAFLQAERESLSARLTEVQREGEARHATKEAEVERLQGRLVRLTLAAESAEAQLADSERASWSVEEDKQRVTTLLSQAQGLYPTLTLPDDLSAPEVEAEALRLTFSTAAAGLAQAGQVRVGPGAMFSPDGVQLDGQIVRVGEIAAFGVAGEHAGALAPAGEGRLRLTPDPAAEVARALASGAVPATLGLFLFEGLDRPAAVAKEKTWEDFFAAGGAVGWLIIALGAVNVLLALYRGWVIRREGGIAEALAARLTPLIEAGDLAAAKALLPAQAAGRALATVLEQVDSSREVLEDAASEAMLREAPGIERLGAPILIIAAVGPLLGLLGTVTGMITTFDVITELGTGDPKMLSGGISEALVTTELGLLVAIPSVLIGNLLNARTEGVLGELERACLKVVSVALAAQRARG
ncbi:MotA/TolQ/ExbB proton channel family protein [Myxococcota bacterium]|nr:MotA/TolQ/ExbB proton channel family protein [Myxococcota bacterium]